MPPRVASRLRHKGAAVCDPLSRVKRLGTKVLKGGDNTELTSMEISSAEDEIDSYMRKASKEEIPGVWTQAGEGFSLVQALYALALRRSCVSMAPTVSDAQRAAHAALRAKLSNELYQITDDETKFAPAQRIRALVWAVLRPHTMRCLSGLLADASAQLSSQPRRPSRRSCQAARDVLDEAQKLVNLVYDLLNTKAEGATIVITDAQLAFGVAKQLKSSRFLEHWSRLLLQLSACRGWAEDAARLLFLLVLLLDTLGRHLGDNVWPHWRHALLANSPCLSYLLSSHVVGLCAWLDGGPTYGMPAAIDDRDDDTCTAPAAASSAAAAAAPAPPSPSSYHVAPVFCRKGYPLLSGSASLASSALVRCALWAWEDVISVERAKDAVEFAARSPPAHTSGGASIQSGSRPTGTAAACAAGAAGSTSGLSAATAVADTSSSSAALSPTANTSGGASSAAEAAAGPTPPLGADSAAAAGSAAASAVPPSSAGDSHAGASASAKPSADGGADETVCAGQPPAPPPLPPVQPRLRMRRVGLGRTPLSATPPLNTAATLELCLRLAAAATEAVKAGGTASGPASAGTAAHTTRGALSHGARLSAAGATTLALRALACGREAIGEEVMVAEALTPATEARVRRWWAALVAFMDVAPTSEWDADEDAEDSGSLDPADWGVLGAAKMAVVAKPDRTATVSSLRLPESPTPCVAAALAAGFVPSLNRLLLNMAELYPSDWLSVMDFPASVLPAWDQLFAFGDPRETSRLVSTLAALVVSSVVSSSGVMPMVAEVLLATERIYGELFGRLMEPINNTDRWKPVIGGARKEEQARAAGTQPAGGRSAAALAPGGAGKVDGSGGGAAEEGSGAGPSGAAGACSGPQSRLGLVLSYVAVKLVPVMRSVLLRTYLPKVRDRGRFLWHHVGSLLQCCGMLAVARGQEARAAAADITTATLGTPSEAAGCSGQDPSPAVSPQPPPVSAPDQPAAGAAPSGEWRRVLMEELCLPDVLGAALGLVLGGGGASASQPLFLALTSSLTGALLMLSTAAPVELVEALTSDAAEELALLAAGPEAVQAEAASGAGAAGAGAGTGSVVFRGLEALLGPQGLIRCDELLAGLRDMCAQASKPSGVAQVRPVFDVSLYPAFQEVAALLVPPSRQMQLLQLQEL